MQKFAHLLDNGIKSDIGSGVVDYDLQVAITSPDQHRRYLPDNGNALATNAYRLPIVELRALPAGKLYIRMWWLALESLDTLAAIASRARSRPSNTARSSDVRRMILLIYGLFVPPRLTRLRSMFRAVRDGLGMK